LDLEYAARQYQRVGRAGDGLYAIYRHINVLPLELVFEMLDRAISELNASGGKGLVIGHLVEILDALSKRADASMEEIAKREYAYLPALGFQEQERTLTLHRLMAERPEFFVQMICDVFKRASAEHSEPTKEERIRGTIAYRLLRSFKLLPGERNGTIDSSSLNNWVQEVRRLGIKEDRSGITDEYVGHALAHAPLDQEDRAWPHRFIRDLIESLESKEVEQGIQVEKYNMRGVVTKGVYDGGAQEHALADIARGWARMCAAWPRTAALLIGMAEMWEAEEKQEDTRARLQKMRD
jgi:hypothetical protein